MRSFTTSYNVFKNLVFVVIFLWMSTSTLPILAFDPIQDLGVDNGGPRLTIINNRGIGSSGTTKALKELHR